MKRTLTTIIAAMLLSLALNAQDLKVISYNIRNSQEKDGTNSWVYRYAASAEMVQDQKADVIGLQEALSDQVVFFEQNFKDYKWTGDFAAILWNKKTVTLQKSGSFDVATWALFKDKETGKKFYFVNTHLDHVGKEARKLGLKLIVDRIDEINPEKYPMVLTGDFNIKPDNEALIDLEEKMQSARKIAPKTDNNQTFNGWGKAKSDMVIDYIYVSGFSACPEYHTVNEKYGQWKYISDHYPIYAKLIF